MLNYVRSELRKFQPDRMRVKKLYRHNTGRDLDLNNPQNLAAKICWLKLYGMTPLHSFCADKIMAPAYIASRIGPGHTPQRLFATYDLRNIGPERIGRLACMIKTNHDSGGIFPVRNVGQEDWDALRGRLQQRLNRDQYAIYRERQYKLIRPGVVVEQLLSTTGPQIVSDIRFYCLNGEPRFIRVTKIDFSDGEPKKIFGATFDLDWNLMNFGLEIDTNEWTEPPADLKGLIEKARRLAQPFALVRVDFLDFGEGCLVGELTFTPNAGIKTFSPFEWDLYWGQQLDHRAPATDWQHHLMAAQNHLDMCKII